MKVKGIYQFYLNYVLPRFEGGFGPESIGMQSVDFKAIVTPKRIADPLYPNSIDETLSSMWVDLRRMDDSDGSIGVVATSQCMDRICVTVDWEADFDAHAAEDEFQKSLQWAVEVADYYLDHYRSVARSPFVERIGRSWRPEDGRFYVHVPHTFCWFNMDDGGKELSILDGCSSRANLGAIRAPESGVFRIAELMSSLATGKEPPLHTSLLIDADGYIRTLGLREATLALASACELAAKLLIERAGGRSDDRVREAMSLNNISFAARYYDRLPEAVGSRGFGSLQPEDFSCIEELYRQRNALIHSGMFEGDVSTVGRSERQKVVYRWLQAAREAVEWIDRIDPANAT